MAQSIERLYKLEVDASQAVRQLKKIGKDTNTLATGFRNIQRAATAAFAVFGAARGIAGIVNAADKIELLSGSFTALLESGDRSADMMERVFRTVQDTGAGLDDTASAFQRLSIGLREVGANNAQIDAVANTFIKLGRISGTSITDTNAALVQFSQGLASGKLQGDELRSIMERLPLITELLADEFSLVNEDIEVTRGQIKQLGKEGKITAQIMGNALIRASEEIANTFEGLIFTLDQELNALKSTATLLIAELSIQTGFGEGLKTGIRGVNQALADLTNNFMPFVEDMAEFVRTSKVAQVALLALSGALAYSLAPAIAVVSTALFNLVIKNPILALATAVALGVVYIIKEWDKLRILFLFDFPIWIDEAQIKIYEWGGEIASYFSTLWADIKNQMGRDVNSIIGYINNAILAMNSTGLTGFSLIGNINFAEQTGKLTEYTDEITKQMVEIMFLEEERAFAIAATGKAAEDAAEQVGYFNNKFAPDPEQLAAMEKRDKEMAKLAETIKNVADPMREINLELEKALELLFIGEITEEQYLAFKASIDGTAEAAEEMAEQIAKSNEEMAEFFTTIEQAVDPFKKLQEQIRAVEVAVEAGLDPVVAEAYINQLIDGFNKTGVAVSSLQADLTLAGNSFVAGFSDNLVDALLEGELAFGDFAKSILEDLAEMILRALIFNSLMDALGTLGIPGLGTAPSTNVGGNSLAPTLLAGGSPTTNAVGVIQPPAYGKGGYDKYGSGVTINVNNNADVDVKTTTRENSQGGTTIDMIIERTVAASLASGGLDPAMSSNYGITRRAY